LPLLKFQPSYTYKEGILKMWLSHQSSSFQSFSRDLSCFETVSCCIFTGVKYYFCTLCPV